jgi:hypothetical protein
MADLGLQVLDNVIMTRWKVLPKEQCQGELGAFALCRRAADGSQVFATSL